MSWMAVVYYLSNDDLEREIAELKAENESLRKIIAELKKPEQPPLSSNNPLFTTSDKIRKARKEWEKNKYYKTKTKKEE